MKFFWEFFYKRDDLPLFSKNFFWEIFQLFLGGTPFFKKFFLGNFWF